ncbi:MAG: hypothetical protein JWP57_1699, partial [Spirosoma sp.]|nr:hypothetical protein [Spirosoma sp.]
MGVEFERYVGLVLPGRHLNLPFDPI